jgi:putative ABC transport system substrate-binding protein
MTLIAAAAATARAARAQPARPTLGFLSVASAEQVAPLVGGFRRGLADAGFAEGDAIAVVYRWAEGRYDRLPDMVEDLIRLRVDAIVASGIVAAQAAKAATRTIPIVFAVGDDPIQFGLVANLNRPEGNVTGVSLVNSTLAPKRLELLHELLPGAGVVGVLVNPGNPNVPATLRELRAAARALTVELEIFAAADDGAFDGVFAAMAERRVGAVLVGDDQLFVARRERLVDLAARHRVPAMYNNREFAAAGGLISYGPRQVDAYRQVGLYAGRIIGGAAPRDLPVLLPVTFELVVNLRSARAIAIAVPATLVSRADEVIE